MKNKKQLINSFVDKIDKMVAKDKDIHGIVYDGIDGQIGFIDSSGVCYTVKVSLEK